jgi:formamidopyrimidine-DNA glycosylase
MDKLWKESEKQDLLENNNNNYPKCPICGTIMEKNVHDNNLFYYCPKGCENKMLD